MSPYPTMNEWTAEKLLKQPLPFRAAFMCLSGQDGLPVYYAQVFAGCGMAREFPVRPIWQSKIRSDIAPQLWPSEAQRVADDACAKLLARRSAAKSRRYFHDLLQRRAKL